ncbi:MAG: Holliday junction resolvase RuvX [Proteobacteria bacterium]|nr:Holliday junction resolvase RuvX [Pseudomonadota bacterium]
MRFLCLDVGTHRIGVAVSDESATIARPLTSLKTAGSFNKVTEELRALCQEYEVQTIVIGLPLSLSGGSRGKSAMAAKEVGARIEKEIGVRVAYWDERFTTREAERVLVDANVRRAKRRQVIDKVAASLILQGYLDARCRDS